MSNCLDHVSSAKVTVDEALAACVQCVAAWSNLMFFYCDSVVFRTFCMGHIITDERHSPRPLSPPHAPNLSPRPVPCSTWSIS